MSARFFLRGLKEKCAFLEEDVRLRKLATDDELDAYRPGGAENLNTDLGAWVFWYATLVRFNGRREYTEARTEAATANAQGTILDALMDRPKSVELQAIDGAAPRTVAAYPKSFEALSFIDSRDRNIVWLNSMSRKLLERDLSVTADALSKVDREVLYQYGLLIWSVTHAGAGLPFPAEDPPATLPDWIRELSSVDIIRIHGAYVEANILRIHSLYFLLEIRTGSTEPDNRLSWATFFSSRAVDTGIEPRALMRDRSLASQIAAALVAADERTRALEEAKKGKEAA